MTRLLAVAMLVAATALVSLLMFEGGGGYTLNARFDNAGQVVTGGLVEVAGRRVGTVTGHRLTDDGLAELELSIDDEWAPLPRGTHAAIRQFGLSGPASRYVELRYPPRRDRGELPDGAVLSTDETTAHVDLDEIFAMFDRRTRRSLKGVFRGSARMFADQRSRKQAVWGRPEAAPKRQYAGQGARANEGWLYLDPALVSATRLFEELDRDTPTLRRFISESSRLSGDVAERREDLAALVSNLADTTSAIARPRGALADAVHQLPPFMRRANTTYVNLRAALDDLDPMVEEFKPVARKLQPYTAELRRLVQDAEPTVRDLARVVRKPGRDNDLVELARAIPPLRSIAVGPVRRNGQRRAGALPAAAEALSGATPRVAFARPYSVDFTGWLDDFSHSGNYDALGGFARIGTHVNAFSFKGGTVSPIAPALRATSLKEQAVLYQNNRCPGSAERDTGDGSTPFKPSADYNCDERQLPPGP